MATFSSSMPIRVCFSENRFLSEQILNRSGNFKQNSKSNFHEKTMPEMWWQALFKKHMKARSFMLQVLRQRVSG